MSKCIGICKLKDGICIGCARSVGEIAAAGRISQLEAILAETAERVELLRSFMEGMPVDCLGSGWAPSCGEWSRRDEVIDSLSTIIRNTRLEENDDV